MLKLNGINKQLGGFSLKNISVMVERGDYFILLGPSGAGKSLLLETIAGLVIPDAGRIELDGRDITREKIQARGTGLVFQDHSLFPHMTVRKNLVFSIRSAGQRQEPDGILELARKMEIDHLLDRYPCTLSGGEAQRVALSRTIIQKPAVLLLDEPLSSIHSGLKAGLMRMLRSLHREGQTILHVTHDFEEAVTLGTRMAVINEGEIVQAGTPAEVLSRPRSKFVADFMGIHNYYPARLETRDNRTIALAGGTIPLPLTGRWEAGEGAIIINGEEILFTGESQEFSPALLYPGTVTEIVATPAGADAYVDIGILIRISLSPERLARIGLKEDRKTGLFIPGSAVSFIPSETGVK
jgi:ABC-type sugar transport system ATPase subunit